MHIYLMLLSIFTVSLDVHASSTLQSRIHDRPKSNILNNGLSSISISPMTSYDNDDSFPEVSPLTPCNDMARLILSPFSSRSASPEPEDPVMRELLSGVKIDHALNASVQRQYCDFFDKRRKEQIASISQCLGVDSQEFQAVLSELRRESIPSWQYRTPPSYGYVSSLSSWHQQLVAELIKYLPGQRVVKAEFRVPNQDSKGAMNVHVHGDRVIVWDLPEHDTLACEKGSDSTSIEYDPAMTEYRDLWTGVLRNAAARILLQNDEFNRTVLELYRRHKENFQDTLDAIRFDRLFKDYQQENNMMVCVKSFFLYVQDCLVEQNSDWVIDGTKVHYLRPIMNDLLHEQDLMRQSRLPQDHDWKKMPHNSVNAVAVRKQYPNLPEKCISSLTAYFAKLDAAKRERCWKLQQAEIDEKPISRDCDGHRASKRERCQEEE